MARRPSKNFFFAKLLRFNPATQKYAFNTAEDKFDTTITSRGTSNLDSAKVTSIVASTAVDSDKTQQIIDSGYIKGIISGNYILNYIDEAYLDDIIDSAYVSARGGGGGGGGGAGSPTITSVSPTAYDGTSGSTITVNGTNFVIGTYVDFITSGGTEYRASATTLVSQAQVTATTPQGFSASDGPLSVKLTTSGGTTTASNVLTTGSSPSWSTGTNLGSFAKNAPVSVTVSATDPQSQPVTYAVKSGSSLPTGLSLNQNTGVISGTLNYSISSNTTVSSIITASDTSSNETDRTFNFTITPTSSISMSFNLPVLGDRYRGPTYTETTNWLQANVSTHGSFDDLFSSYGSANSTQQGIYWLRAARKVRVDYVISGASGGRGYGYRSYGSGMPRKITGSFYCNANNHIGMMVGRHGDGYYTSSYPYVAAGGGGASCIFVARSGYAGNSSYWYPAVIAAGGGGYPGGAGSYWTSHDMWSALPLDYPYRVGDATGGRINAQAYRADGYFFTAGGAGWDYDGDLWSTSANYNRLGASRLRSNQFAGQSGRYANATSRALGTNYGSSYTWYLLKGGFGGGGGTWYQRNTSASGNYTYSAPGGGAGGYYGGYPTSHSNEGGTSAINNLPRQYPFVTYQGTGHSSTNSTPTTLQGSNNNYFGAYSYALGLESTGTYTQNGGDVDGTAPSAGATGQTSYGAYWDASLPRPTDNGWINSTITDGSIAVTISAA